MDDVWLPIMKTDRRMPRLYARGRWLLICTALALYITNSRRRGKAEDIDCSSTLPHAYMTKQ